MHGHCPDTSHSGLGYCGAQSKVGGPRDGTHSRYLGRRFSGLRCGSVQNSIGRWERRGAGTVAVMVAVSLMWREPMAANPPDWCTNSPHPQVIGGTYVDDVPGRGRDLSLGDRHCGRAADLIVDDRRRGSGREL